MYTGKYIPVPDFSGGQNSNVPVTEVGPTEALDLSNLVVRYNGKGFRQRYGDTAYNAVATTGSVHGLGYYKKADNTDFLVAVSGTKVYKDAGLAGTFSDVTGTLTITAGNNNHWTLVPFNNSLMGFGGPPTNPDAPWKYTGTGNAAALGGTPPSAYGAFQVNNRMFAYRTNANPSTIYWSILSNEADWTGVGSGSADVYTSDNDSVTAHAILTTNSVLLFKENSIHQMQVSAAPFPIYPLFKGVGCAGKHAVVVADGLCYFINNQGRMRITDGATIYDERQIPALAKIDDVWATLTAGRAAYIQGVRKIGVDYDHIVWAVSLNGSTTNDTAIVWDLKNKCWLKHTTGYKSNVFALHQNGNLYAGHYAGDVYLKDQSTVATDASEAGAAVVGQWTSGWTSLDSLETIKQLRKVDIGFRVGTTGTFKFNWGFDFVSNTNSVSISQTVTAATWDSATWDASSWSSTFDFLTNQRMTGRGNVFQYQLSNASSTQWQINSVAFSGKASGQKNISAS